MHSARQQVQNLIQQNQQLMRILTLIRELDLNQGVLAAGSIRNTVWQALHHQPFELISDIDVIFFDLTLPEVANEQIQKRLKSRAPQYTWQVKNEAYLHNYDFNGQRPFTSVTDAISHFVETPTSIGAYLEDDSVKMLTPFGAEDLVNLRVRPVPVFRNDAQYLAIYHQRIATKQWQKRWPRLTFFDD